jgi:hypothetical protein
MFRRRCIVPMVLVCCVPAASPVVADDDVRPQAAYTLDLRARLPAEKDFSDKSLKVAVHVSHDPRAGRLFYAAADGKALAVVPAGQDGSGDRDKAPRRLHRLLLPVRGWDEKAFGDQTPKVSVEVYCDENTGNVVYLSHAGFFAVVHGLKVDAGKAAKEPRWLDRLRLKVRPSDEKDFVFEYLKCNLEVYEDENTGCMVYVTANGALSVIALGKAGDGKETREPAWDHAVLSRARAYREEDFTPKTLTWSAEVFLDEGRGVRVYATDKLQVAATPGGKAKDPNKVQPLEWQKRLRSKEAKEGGKWSAEVFLNPNNDDQLFVTASGALAVVGPNAGGKPPAR